MSSNFTATNLLRTLNQLQLRTNAVPFESLQNRYTEPHRHYHNEQHITDCLAWLSRFQSRSERPAEVALALWFHDAIYEPLEHDNELRSAEWAAEFVLAAGGTQEVSDRIRDLILVTQTHQATTKDQQLLVDIDLAILGAEPEQFDAYDAAIRQEYLQVPDDLYRPARADILRRFQDRPRIYHTPVLHDLLESQARINLDRKIRELES